MLLGLAGGVGFGSLRVGGLCWWVFVGSCGVWFFALVGGGRFFFGGLGVDCC